VLNKGVPGRGLILGVQGDTCMHPYPIRCEWRTCARVHLCASVCVCAVCSVQCAVCVCARVQPSAQARFTACTHGDAADPLPSIQWPSTPMALRQGSDAAGIRDVLPTWIGSWDPTPTQQDGRMGSDTHSARRLHCAFGHIR
jgi:hypothetical protein